MAFQVGGINQTGTSASDTLTVDRKVNLTVAEVGTTTTQVSPGQTSAVTAFTVTNTSNAVLDFALVAAQQTGGAGAHANTDTFDTSNVRIFRDSNGSNSYDSGDAQITYLDELAADGSATVFVVSDVPLSLATGSVAVVTLTATARAGGGPAVRVRHWCRPAVATPPAWTPCSQMVLGRPTDCATPHFLPRTITPCWLRR
ncbi:hypothetical protein [Novosphingobium sp. THN1]|uniref:hypothetical protein n=1 Tax=Novosphingobium sp. THN1 TaxID=1016987 RepID=UPI001F07DE12|nr:hypothetical protein [Novosphingobium sp. THN1]